MGQAKSQFLLAVVVLGIVVSAAAIAWAALPDREPAILLAGEDGQITLISASGGVVRRLGEGGSSAVWSPDGAKIAVGPMTFPLIDDDAKIWTIDSDGGDRRELAVGERPLWSPDGTRIAFIRRSDNVIPFDTVWTMDADGGHQRLVARADVAGWSPDGRWLAYSTDDDVRIVAATGGPSRVLSRKAEVSAIRWSPDGRWVLVEAAGKSFLVRSDGSMVRALDGTDGAWSPDGRTIAVRRSRPCSRGALYLVDVDGTSERQLTRGDYDDDQPSWSPTGDRIAFTRGPGGLGGWERNEIYAVSLADGGIRRLTENDYDDSSPRWRPPHERAALPVVKVPRLPANRPPEPGELPLPVLRRSPPLKPLEPVRMPAPTVTVLEPPPYSARVLSLPKLTGCEAN